MLFSNRPLNSHFRNEVCYRFIRIKTFSDSEDELYIIFNVISQQKPLLCHTIEEETMTRTDSFVASLLRVPGLTSSTSLAPGSQTRPCNRGIATSESHNKAKVRRIRKILSQKLLKYVLPRGRTFGKTSWRNKRSCQFLSYQAIRTAALRFGFS